MKTTKRPVLYEVPKFRVGCIWGCIIVAYTQVTIAGYTYVIFQQRPVGHPALRSTMGPGGSTEIIF